MANEDERGLIRQDPLFTSININVQRDNIDMILERQPEQFNLSNRGSKDAIKQSFAYKDGQRRVNTDDMWAPTPNNRNSRPNN